MSTSRSFSPNSVEKLSNAYSKCYSLVLNQGGTVEVSGIFRGKSVPNGSCDMSMVHPGRTSFCETVALGLAPGSFPAQFQAQCLLYGAHAPFYCADTLKKKTSPKALRAIPPNFAATGSGDLFICISTAQAAVS